MGSKKKRKGEDVEMMGRKELLHKIRGLNTYNSVRDRALVAFTYLLGSRISEVLGMKDGKKWIIEPIKKYQIEEKEVNKTKFMVVFHVRALKRKKKIYRNIPINYESYKGFIEIIKEYTDTLNDGDYLFSFTRQRAWQIINKELGLFCHYFRHLRSSHLVEYDGYTEGDLMRQHGWSSAKMGVVYVHLDWQYLAKKQI